MGGYGWDWIDGAAGGQPDDHVRPHRPVLPRDGDLLEEVAVLDETRDLHCAPQVDLRPPPPQRRGAERVGETRRLGLQGFHLLAERRVRADPRLLDVLYPPIELLQRLLHRFHQLLDGLVALGEIALGSLLELLQRGAGELQEVLAVGPQRLGGERLEGGSELLLRLLDEPELLLGGALLSLERGSERGALRPHLGEVAAQIGFPRARRFDLPAQLGESQVAVGEKLLRPGAVGRASAPPERPHQGGARGESDDEDRCHAAPPLFPSYASGRVRHSS